MRSWCVSVPQVAASTNGSDLILSVATTVGQRYRVEQTADLTTTAPWSIVADNIAGNGGQVPVTDYGALAAASRYYRVVVLP